MLAFLFGKKRKPSKKPKKLPKALLKLARKYRIKVTVRRGSKKVYKPISVIKKQIKMKMKRKSSPKRRRARFGFGLDGGQFIRNPKDYGYGSDVDQINGVVPYTSQVVQNVKANNARLSRIEIGKGKYMDTRLSKNQLPVYGVGKTFFNDTIPGVLPPNHMYMGQPDGSMVALGSPFSAYKKPAFGKKKTSGARVLSNKFPGVLSGARGMSVTFMSGAGKNVTRKLKKEKKNMYTFKIKTRRGGSIFKVTGPLKKGKKVTVTLLRKLR